MYTDREEPSTASRALVEDTSRWWWAQHESGDEEYTRVQRMRGRNGGRITLDGERERERGGCPLRPKIRSSSEDQRSERIVDFFFLFFTKKKGGSGTELEGTKLSGGGDAQHPLRKKGFKANTGELDKKFSCQNCG